MNARQRARFEERLSLTSKLPYRTPQEVAELFYSAACQDEAEAVRGLVETAQAVIDRWETPAWKDAPATATFIYALRDALKDWKGE